MTHRVVITGIGVIAPPGARKENFWAGLKSGSSAVSAIEGFDCAQFSTRIAAQVKNFDPLEFLDRKFASRLDRSAQFAVCAALQAYDDARITFDASQARRVGVFEGTAMGGLNLNFEMYRHYLAEGAPGVSPLALINGMTGNGSSSITRMLHIHGPAVTLSSGCVSSSYAIGDAYRKIKYGELDAAIAGGAEAPISAEILKLLSSMRLLSTANESPACACKPFDAHRDGFVVGEGGAMLVIESLEHALQRDAHIYAEILGIGASSDAYHATSPSPGGEFIALAMSAALEEANLGPAEIQYINAHGTATPMNDVVETMALRRIFGQECDRIPVSSTKSVTGHLLGACGALEMVIAALAICDGWIPPTMNLTNPDPRCDLDYVPRLGRPADLRIVMTNNYSFGGRNSSAILRRFNHETRGG